MSGDIIDLASRAVYSACNSELGGLIILVQVVDTGWVQVTALT